MTIVESTDHGAVRCIALNRPERLNAITPDLVTGLCAALREAHADPGLRALVLTGRGRSFCAGDDLHEVDAQTASSDVVARYVDELQEVTRLLMDGPVPVIGAVRGWAVGGGLEWMLNCDLVVAGEGARGFFPELGLGLFMTGGVTHLLPRIVGATRARELLLLGERIDARRMLEWGMVTRVVPDEAVEAAALELADRIAALPAERVADLRRALREAEAGLEAALRIETAATVAGFTDPATRARIEERRPGR